MAIQVSRASVAAGLIAVAALVLGAAIEKGSSASSGEPLLIYTVQRIIPNGRTDYDLCAMTPSTRVSARLTALSTSSDFQPAWSPDGRAVAFTRQTDSDPVTADIVIARPPGSGARNITRREGADLGPSWAPDGRRIVFSTHGLEVINSDGTGRRVLFAAGGAGAGSPDWAPMGGLIAFAYSFQSTAVYVINEDGTGAHQLIEDARSPAWSPDGERIAFTRSTPQSHVYIANADGSGAIQVTHADAGDFFPTWAPDGRRLAFIRTRGLSRDVYVVNADGSGERQMTKTPFEELYPAWQPLNAGGGAPSTTPCSIVGTTGPDKLNGSLGRDVMYGGAGADVLRAKSGGDIADGQGGDDRVYGDTGSDILGGGPGNDRLSGEAGSDALYGGSGRDALLGGAGRDLLYGGRGNDAIDAADGARDVIQCGSGVDRVFADRIDFAGRDCEHVRRTPSRSRPRARGLRPARRLRS